MLFESISYTGELPFELSFLNIGDESKHCHKEIELLLVLRGVTHYQIYHTDYELNPGDLIIADVEDLHQIHDSSDDILLLSIHVDTGRFEHLYPNIRYMFFVCEECMEGPSGNKQLLQSKLILLKHCIAKLAFDYMCQDQDLLLLTEGVNELVSILVNHFQGFFMEDFQYKTSQEDMSGEDLQRLCRITRYIMLNYKEKISLNDVSETEHLSSYYLSHLIKENLGFNFQNFVNSIRLEYAEKLLVFSNMTLMQISQECGFSSPNYFNKCFSAWHGKTPAQYRKDYVPKERSFKNPFTKEEALTLLSSYLNTSKKTKEQSRFLSLSPDFNTCQTCDFWENFAPHIFIDSLDAALMLGFCQSKLHCIRPAGFLMDTKHSKELDCLEKALTDFHCSLQTGPSPQNFLKAGNLAAAFSQILRNKHPHVLLLGQEQALFSQENLETPIYDAYRFFVDFEHPQVSVEKNYVLVKDKNDFTIVLFNTDPHSALNIRISTGNLPQGATIVRREISPHDNCLAILEALKPLKPISPLLKRKIRQSTWGKAQFSKLDRKANPYLDFTIYRNATLILEILQE